MSEKKREKEIANEFDNQMRGKVMFTFLTPSVKTINLTVLSINHNSAPVVTSCFIDLI